MGEAGREKRIKDEDFFFFFNSVWSGFGGILLDFLLLFWFLKVALAREQAVFRIGTWRFMPTKRWIYLRKR